MDSVPLYNLPMSEENNLDAGPPSFNTMWKEWISLMPGMPQNVNARDRAKKLFEKVFKEWQTIWGYNGNIEEKAYARGYEKGVEHGYWQGQRDFKEKIYETVDELDIPDHSPEDKE